MSFALSSTPDKASGASADLEASWATPLTFVRPSVIEFGPGKAGSVGRWAAERGMRRALVISDAFNATRTAVLALPGDVTVFDRFQPEPTLTNLESLLATVRSVRPDLIVGFGGGSAMDLAKLASVLIDETRPITDLVGPGKVGPRKVSLVQVPTTAGTGSEAGTRSLITDPQTLAKLAFEGPGMLADMVVIDPGLTMTVPPAVTAATGVDALAHCVEAFTSKRAHPVIDMYAREGIRLVGRFLARAVTDGSDLEARAGMALASFYGGICLGPVNTTAGHALSYPLGTRHKVPHGLANALVFPHTLAFNAPARPEKTAEIAKLLGFASDIQNGALRFCEGLGIDPRISSLGVPEDDLPVMAAQAHQIRRLLDFNPRDMTVEDILALYRSAY